MGLELAVHIVGHQIDVFLTVRFYRFIQCGAKGRVSKALLLSPP